MSRFKTRYGCLFCHVVHGVEYTIGQHQDAFLAEYRSAVRPPSHSQIPFHPVEIVRAVRSTHARDASLHEAPADADVLDECSTWSLTVPLYSTAEVRAHGRLDRSELTSDWWLAFARAGLTPNDRSDPRVGTGYVEWLERQRLARARADRLLAAAAAEAARIVQEQRVIDAAQQAARRDAARLAVRDKGKGRAIVIDSESECESESDTESDTDTDGDDEDVPSASAPSISDAADFNAVSGNSTRTTGGVCVNYGNIENQGPAAVGMGTVGLSAIVTPRGKQGGRAPPTPVAGPPLVIFRLRLSDTGAVVPITGTDSLDTVLARLKEDMSAGVREAVVGLAGAGNVPLWAKIGERWSAQWDAALWETVKKRAGRAVVVQTVRVELVWRFDE